MPYTFMMVLSPRFRYGILPMPDSEEQDWSPRNKGEVVYDMEDLVGSSGGHVTVIKAHAGPMPKIVKARKVMSGGKSKAMKAIFVEPTQIEAKRVHVMKADVESVMATKGELLGGEPMTVYGSKAKAAPVSVQKGVVTKGGKDEDWAASSLHFTKADPPHEEEERSMRGDEGHPELHCGGTHDLGWCDLGESYPRAEVSQIMEVCEDLVSRMYVEVPEDPDDMEDIASYSLSRNISGGGKPQWPQWRSAAPDMKRSLCDVKRNVIRPSFAQDVKGKWHVIIQTDAFLQRIALEVCKKPGGGCSRRDLCSSSQSQCVQRYSYQQLISFDPESAETCPYVRLYKFPTSCVCRMT
ncbi:hypothetical protein JTE90_003601 [Oedothorax gibbosus]|uniref:Spaetzle domain-containing protein n=1 Tax=Oedothorax gibbosus TaxID=931172 RepID=A0AAV6VDL2_9ARAC|nr:hypothetical protein JTE90_003601 [Oedothorax gibbosus]